jgi:toxin CcdB
MTNQFDVFPNPAKKGRDDRPFVVDVQSYQFRNLNTRIIIPLILGTKNQEIPRLMPQFIIERKRLYLQPLEIAVYPARLLRNAVANLESERYQIISAIDLVFTGA